MKKTSPFKQTSIAMSLVIAAHPVIAANETEVVEVSGYVQDIKDIYIDSDDLEKSQAQDLNDVFRKEAEISVGGTSSVSQKIYVRGLEDTMLNVTIDGADQSSSLFHHQGAVSIEPELLKQVTANAGAGRATNGPGSIGGAIQFETKDAQDLLKPGQSFGALTKAGYYSNGDGYKASANLYGSVNDKLALLGAFSYFKSDDFEDGEGEQITHSGTELKSGLVKLSGHLNEQNYVAVSYEVREDQAERLHRPNWAESSGNPALDQESNRQTITLKHGYSSGDLINLVSTLYLTDAEIKHIEHPTYGTTEGSIETIGIKLQNQSTVNEHRLTYGIDYKDDSSDYENIRYSELAEESGTVYGIYLQDDWELSEKWLLTGGARYDWYELTDSDKTNFESSGFSPNVGLNYQPATDLNLFASYAKAFRGQQVKELFTIAEANDPSRKAEKATNTEVGASYSYQVFSAGVTYFDSTIEDVVGLSYSPTRWVTNLGKLTNKGITAYLGYTTQPLSARLSYSQSNPEIDGEPLTDDNTNIGTSMGDKWVLDVSYFASENIELGWTATFVERFTDVADPEANPEKPGYGVHDLYAQWLPVDSEDLKLTLSVKNVFNKYYHDHASYYSYIGSTLAKGTASPGRDVRFNVSYEF